MELIPAVLKNDVVQAQIVMAELRKAGLKVSRVQVDFVDGKYNTNLTFRPSEFDITQYYPVKFDAHLMVVEDNVLTWSMVAEKVGYERVFVQLESISHPEEYEYLALDVHSPVTALKAEWLAKLKGVLILGVEPGFGGQERHVPRGRHPGAAHGGGDEVPRQPHGSRLRGRRGRCHLCRR
jgi:pentose-5-phosphate-3-epimerase